MFSELLFLLGIYAVAVLADIKPPKYDSYSVSGYIELPYAELKEPFDGYLDAENKRARIDYYGGVYDVIQMNGNQYKIFYKTTEQFTNKRVCAIFNQYQIPQKSIPDVTTHPYTYAGNETLDGRPALKFVHKEKVLKRINKYTLWVHSETNAPLKYEMMGFDSLMGSHFDKYYIIYTSFTSGSPDKSHWALPKDCESVASPTAEETVSSNPMSHLIGPNYGTYDEMWSEFKEFHGKIYPNAYHHATRHSKFLQNARFIHSMNRQNLTFKMAVNHLADYNEAELRAMRGYRQVVPKKPINSKLLQMESSNLVSDVPEEFDWRLRGAVTQVKDQAICGSCWSFGSAEAIEGAYFLKTGDRVRLSQQQLVDCSWGEGNNGCDGGEDVPAYQYASRHGLATEEEYGSYLGIDGKCKQNEMKGMKVFVEATPRAFPPADTELAKKYMVAYGPVSVAIDASHKTFSFYSYGVYNDPQCSSTNLDHAVLAVGYGTIGGEPYWIVKNSWSTYWGNNGYVLISQKNNLCGVLTSATQPIIKQH